MSELLWGTPHVVRTFTIKKNWEKEVAQRDRLVLNDRVFGGCHSPKIPSQPPRNRKCLEQREGYTSVPTPSRLRAFKTRRIAVEYFSPSHCPKGSRKAHDWTEPPIRVGLNHMGSIGLKRAGAQNTPSSSPCRVSGDKSETCAAREKFSTFPGLPGLRVASTGNNVQCSIIGPSPAPHTNPSTRSRANSLHRMSIYSSHFHSFRTPRQVYLPQSPSRAIQL